MTSDLPSAIGTRVRQRRHARHWTLDQLAAVAGVSRRVVVNVEQGTANPSLATLLRLGEALGVGLPALVEPPRTRSLQVTRSGDGAVLWRGEAGGRATLVSASSEPEVVELWDWTLGPGDRHHSEPHVGGARELLHVLEGTVTVESGGQAATLAPGDAVAFPGDVDHAYVNLDDQPARFALTVFEPGPGPATSRPRTHSAADGSR